MTDAPTIRLTEMQHADALTYSFLSLLMAGQPDADKHFYAAACFMKLQARARRAHAMTEKEKAKRLNARQEAARRNARSDIDGLLATIAGYMQRPERLAASHNEDGTITLLCQGRSIVLGKTHGA